MSKRDFSPKDIKRLLSILPKDKQDEILSTLSETELKVMGLRHGIKRPTPAAVEAQKKVDENVRKTKPS